MPKSDKADKAATAKAAKPTAKSTDKAAEKSTAKPTAKPTDRPADGGAPDAKAIHHPTIEAKKVYLKDASFESPASPHIFAKGEPKPKLDVQMTLTHQRIQKGQDYYEVVLNTTVTASNEGENMFLAEVQQAGIFHITHINADNLEAVLETACPHILLPFAREAMASLISKGGFPQLLLGPMNFQAIYLRKKAQQAQDAGKRAN